jgi:proline dehydrogenase
MPGLLKSLDKMGLSGPVYWTGKETFFRHFCGGEEAKDVIPTMKTLQASNIKSILDLSIEADLSSDNTGGGSALERKVQDYERQGIASDKIVEMLKECVITSNAGPDNICAIKITSLTSTQLLQHVSQLVRDQKKVFKLCDKNNDGSLTLDEFTYMIKTYYPNKSFIKTVSIDELFSKLDTDNDGKIDFVDVRRLLNVHNQELRKIFLGEKNDNALLDELDLQEIDRLMERINTLADLAQKNKVGLMFDAEQTYFQPAIDSIVLQVMKKYNRKSHGGSALIYQTYQMYLKDSFDRLVQDYTESKRFGFYFGAKLVRGAYMVSERQRSIEKNYEDPIQPSISSTHENYNNGVSFLLDEMKSTNADSQDINLVVASHNLDSVKLVIQKMHDLNLQKTHPRNISFGQLLGMCDYISYGLGQNGYRVYKYVPYGPIREVFPYLLRRAQENSSVLKNSVHDQYFLKKELWRRLSK